MYAIHKYHANPNDSDCMCSDFVCGIIVIL